MAEIEADTWIQLQTIFVMSQTAINSYGDFPVSCVKAIPITITQCLMLAFGETTIIITTYWEIYECVAVLSGVPQAFSHDNNETCLHFYVYNG